MASAAAMFSLAGKVALVTGAASGIGRGIAAVLSENGAAVALLDRDAGALDRVAAEFRDRGLDAWPLVIDVADTAALAGAIDGVAARRGRLDIAVANAGMSAGPGFTTEQGRMAAVDETAWRRVLDVNLTGTFETIRSSARHMVPRRTGRIIAVSSIAGLKSERMVGYAYAATKAAVVNLVRQAAMELAPHNVLVTGIAPGPFRTNIGGGRYREPEVMRAFTELVPLGRIADVEEIQGLALLLASDASSFMTGVTIPIDGGVIAR